jgi:hypothetical protein
MGYASWQPVYILPTQGRSSSAEDQRPLFFAEMHPRFPQESLRRKLISETLAFL